ncbi:hypothetical protein [Streptomyces sp. NPDC018693]|uniref:hypothetical protein n=1 Tax=unclassified Streptomyces TaxID=2593676 RepID=UPI00378859A9
MGKRLRRVVPVLLAAVSLSSVSGCGPTDESDAAPKSPVPSVSSPTATSPTPVPPTPTPTPTSASPVPSAAKTTSPPTPTRPAWPRVTFARLSFEIPPGWELTRSGEYDACVQPVGRAGLPMTFGCTGIAIRTGTILGNEGRPYEARQPGGWYHASDAQPCPAGRTLADGSFNYINSGSSAPPVESGLRPVGDRKAAYDRWTATCTSGYRFSPQAWHLPVSRVLFLDYTGHAETGRVLESVRFPG